jgi:menaquinone-dependent protoporphyrinogen oxidase
MRVLIVFGTTEGQTAKIAGFVADRLRARGHDALLIKAGVDAVSPDPAAFDAVLVAASLHAGRYQPAAIEFVRRHRAAITARKNAFLSVSLAAAGHDAEDRTGLERCVTAFVGESGWSPDRIDHVAGAFRYTVYDFFKRWAMKYIAYRKGAPTDTSRDYELTDWDELGRFVDTFISDAASGAKRNSPA